MVPVQQIRVVTGRPLQAEMVFYEQAGGDVPFDIFFSQCGEGFFVFDAVALVGRELPAEGEGFGVGEGADAVED